MKWRDEVAQRNVFGTHEGWGGGGGQVTCEEAPGADSGCRLTGGLAVVLTRG